MDRFDELLSEYLDGALDRAGRDELASMIDADPARREMFVALVREHKLLASDLGGQAEDAFARRVMSELNKDRSQFVRAVMEDLKGPGSGGRRPSPPQPPRRTFRPQGNQGPGWVLWASLVAGALVIVVLLLSMTGGDEPSKPDRKIAKEPPRPAPVVPAPEPRPAPEVVKETPTPPAPKPNVPAPPKPEPKAPEAPVAVTPSPKPETPPAPPPAPRPEPVAPVKAPVTVAEVAKLDSVEGDVTLGGVAAVPGPLTAGFVLETKGEKSVAVFRYPDGTKVEVGPLSKIQDEPTRPGHVLTLSGVLQADVAKQPVDAPMLVLTAHAEARVLGTKLKLETIGDSSRLDVIEGKVRFTRLKDKASVDVAAAHYAVAMPTGMMVSRLARVSSGEVALYTFKEGKGGTVRDVSRSGAALDLVIENEAAVKWTPKGLQIHASTLVASVVPATKISQACKASNEVTVEAWVRPGTVTPPGKDGRIVGLSADTMNQNFLLGQDELTAPARSYFMRLRTTTTDLVGKPALATPANTTVLKLSHVVYTRSSTGLATLYVDGVDVARTTGGGALSNWNESYRLSVGNELTGDRPWVGEVHLVAVFSRALTADEVKQNFKAGAE